ncbi:MAG TPA: hypothetical protein VF598_01535 [Hymenobacter sp.]|jgi:hypothetical protein
MAANTSETKYRIAVLDEEQAERDNFINYFEDMFDVVEITKLVNIEELIDVIKSESIDGIAIDYKLKDHGSAFQFNGDYFFKELNQLLLDFPSFILTNDPDNAKKESPAIVPFFIIDKGRISQGNSSLKDDVFKVIDIYKSNIKLNQDRLKELIEIKKSTTLSPKLEQEYININLFLEKTTYSSGVPAASFYSTAIDEKISKLLKSTQDLINELSDND